MTPTKYIIGFKKGAVFLSVFLLSIGLTPLFNFNKADAATFPIGVGLPCKIKPGQSYWDINSRRAHTHDALHGYAFDLQQNDECETNEVVASFSGTIQTTPESFNCNGTFVTNSKIIITRADGLKAKYYHHNYDYTTTVSDGYVNAGEVLATIGQVGCASGPHIHFEVLKPNSSDTDRYSYSSNYSNLENQWEFKEDVVAPPIVFTNYNVALTTFNSELFRAYSRNGTIISEKSIDGTNWSLSNNVGSTVRNVEMIAFKQKLYQATRGGSQAVSVRNYSNGTWSAWTALGGKTDYDVTMEVFDGNLFLFVRGLSGTVSYRNTSDGVNWSAWKALTATGGTTSSEKIDANVLFDRLYLTMRGSSGKVYTSYARLGKWQTENFTSWVNDDPNFLTDEEVRTIVIPVSATEKKLYLIVPGLDGTVHVKIIRSLLDSNGIRKYNVGVWTRYAEGSMANDVEPYYFNNTLYLAGPGGSAKIYTKKYPSGAWLLGTEGSTTGNVSMTKFGTKLYQFAKGKSSEKIYSRSTSDGITWSVWQ